MPASHFAARTFLKRPAFAVITALTLAIKHTGLMNEMAWIESPILYRPLTREPRPFIQVAIRTPATIGGLGHFIQDQISSLDSGRLQLRHVESHARHVPHRSDPMIALRDE